MIWLSRGKDALLIGSTTRIKRTAYKRLPSEQWLVMAVACALASVGQAQEIRLPAVDQEHPIAISAQRASRWQQGSYEVWLLGGSVTIRQGNQLSRAGEAVLWIEHATPVEQRPTKVIAYLENRVMLETFAAKQPGANFQPTSRQTSPDWFGRLYTDRPLEIRVPPPTGEPTPKPPVYRRAMAKRAPQTDQMIRQAQFNLPAESAPASGQTPRGRRIRAFPRSEARVQAQWFPSADGTRSVAVIDSGVNLIVDGLEALGTVDVAADRLVIWTTGARPDLSGQQMQSAETPLEIYMEGNIVFRQGERVIYAQRMYYDVTRRVGTVLNAEILTPAPDYQGLVRLKASVLRQLDEHRFVAHDGQLTSSRIGEPRYRFQSNEIYFEDIQLPKLNPFTGAQEIDPETGQPAIEHQRLATAEGNKIYIGPVPVAYWPTLATDLTDPIYYLNSARFGTDNIFGTQVSAEWNAYQVFGIRNKPSGTKWSLNTDFFSERGPGGGMTFEYDRPDFFFFDGPSQGNFDAWFIYDTGLDDLGRGRRGLTPEDEFRGKVDWQHRHRLPSGWTLSAELGWISDRNFLEQYFEKQWDEEKDRTTGLELKRIVDNRSFSVLADVRLNDFFTQTQWLPKVDHYWLGESLFGDRITWFEHSQAAYAQFRSATAPTAPEEAALYDPLAWETDPATGTFPVNTNGERFVTRQEIDLPFSLGPIKIVPYGLGELAHWGEDLTRDDVQRAYFQTGARASIPFWSVNPAVESQLFNLHGLAHKVVFDAEFAYADASENPDRLPLYDPLDDDAIEAFRRQFYFTSFDGVPGGNVPLRFDERNYAFRSGLQSHVTSPSTEIADDLMTVRFGMNHRWQTKRGVPGNRRIVDYFVLDANATWFPREDRDNFGQPIGLVDYAARWHVGDRVTLLSDGAFDFFGDGLRVVNVGGILNRPSRGRIYLGFRAIDGPVQANVLTASLNYWMSPKWVSTLGASVDLADTGNIGQKLSLTRVGESALLRFGVNVDSGKDSVGVNVMLEPRFLPPSARSRLSGVTIPPAGLYGLE